MNARPRQWVALVGFRATRVEADFGYVEYRIICQHREAWQNIGTHLKYLQFFYFCCTTNLTKRQCSFKKGPILQSKADLSSFCLELSKKLDLRYVSPPMPVNLTTSGLNLSGVINYDRSENDAKERESAEKTLTAEDLQDVAALFEVRE